MVHRISNEMSFVLVNRYLDRHPYWGIRRKPLMSSGMQGHGVTGIVCAKLQGIRLISLVSAAMRTSEILPLITMGKLLGSQHFRFTGCQMNCVLYWSMDIVSFAKIPGGPMLIQDPKMTHPEQLNPNELRNVGSWGHWNCFCQITRNYTRKFRFSEPKCEIGHFWSVFGPKYFYEVL